MRTQSMIIDDFLETPDIIRSILISSSMQDYKAEDGVTYPGIVPLTPELQVYIKQRISQVFPNANCHRMFARFSMEHMSPPNFAHSDREMTEHIALIYLSPPKALEKYGTYLLKHIPTGMETHPSDPEGVKILRTQSNVMENWQVTFLCPSRYNRCFILNADYIHGAAGKFGKTKEDARLVLTVFFNLEDQKEAD